MPSTDLKRVLHIAMDYPSHNRPVNTTAVRQFVKGNPELDYFVFVLTRCANPWRCNAIDGDGNGDAKTYSVRYWGLPFGILLFFSMTLVAWRLYRNIQRHQLSFDAIHAHKMTFEGITAWWLSRWLNLPLLISVRGESDLRVLKYKPHYHRFFQRQLNDCVGIYYVSAYARPLLNRQFHIDESKQHLLPNFVVHPPSVAQTVLLPQHLVTILDLNVYKKKGLDRLLAAFARVKLQFPDARLDIIGRGDGSVRRRIMALVEQLGLSDSVKLLGELSNDQLLKELPKYSAMTLPSHRETFGMVYVEALLNGVPILHSRHTGIDGFIDWVPSRVAVEPNSETEIYDGLCYLLEHHHEMKSWLNEHREELKKAFSQSRYLTAYNRTIYSLDQGQKNLEPGTIRAL